MCIRHDAHLLELPFSFPAHLHHLLSLFPIDLSAFIESEGWQQYFASEVTESTLGEWSQLIGRMKTVWLHHVPQTRCLIRIEQRRYLSRLGQTLYLRAVLLVSSRLATRGSFVVRCGFLVTELHHHISRWWIAKHVEISSKVLRPIWWRVRCLMQQSNWCLALTNSVRRHKVGRHVRSPASRHQIWRSQWACPWKSPILCWVHAVRWWSCRISRILTPRTLHIAAVRKLIKVLCSQGKLCRVFLLSLSVTLIIVDLLLFLVTALVRQMFAWDDWLLLFKFWLSCSFFGILLLLIKFAYIFVIQMTFRSLDFFVWSLFAD